jgi:hypothetical protein
MCIDVTLNNISVMQWRLVLSVEETEEYHLLFTIHCQSLSRKVASRYTLSCTAIECTFQSYYEVIAYVDVNPTII